LFRLGVVCWEAAGEAGGRGVLDDLDQVAEPQAEPGEFGRSRRAC